MHVQCMYLVAVITTPPENTTVCIGSDVNISCGYQWAIVSHITWVIDGTLFDQSAIENSPLYQLNNPTNSSTLSLTVFSINDTTTIQCIIPSIPITASTLGTITVIGMCTCVYVYTYNYNKFLLTT